MEFKVKTFSGLLKYAGRMIGLSLFFDRTTRNRRSPRIGAVLKVCMTFLLA